MIDNLKNAIIGDSLKIVAAQQHKGWKATAIVIVDEITHLATTMPADIAQGLLVDLLADVVFDRLRTIAKHHGIPTRPLTDKIH